MDVNISEFKEKEFLETDDLNVDTNELVTLDTTDFQDVHYIAILPEHVENNGKTDKMFSEESLNFNEEATSVDSKRPKASKKLTSILNLNYPSFSKIITSKKNDSFMKQQPAKRYECYKCNKHFPSFGEVAAHLKLIHNACATRDCSKISNFQLHSTVCANRGFGCSICNKTFQEKQLLLMHFNEHINAAFYACEVCREGFQQRKDLQKHFFQIHKKFLSLPVASAHSKTVYQKCENCSKYFKLFAEFEEHASSCNSSTYACYVCKVCFASLSDLEEHKLTEHKTEQALKGNVALQHGKRYFCGICFMGFYKGGILKEHVMTHKEEASFICDECHITFACDNELQEHYLRHVEEHYVLHDVISQHSCSSCTKMFKTQKELKFHLKLKNCKNVNKKGDPKVQGKMSGNNCTSDKENAGDNSASQNTLESMSIAPDFSNIPVYVMKVGEDLLNCDDSQCVVVMDLTSLFILQIGTCASENRMPDVKNCEIYSESEYVDTSLLTDYMQQILTHVESIQAPETNLEQTDFGNVETIVVSIDEVDENFIKSVEGDSMSFQPVTVAEFEESENINGKYEFLIYDNTNKAAESNVSDSEGSSNKIVVEENKVESADNLNAVDKELLVESDDSLGISGLYICNICKQVFSSKTSLCLHVKGSHTGYDCYRCGDSFTSEEELKNHEKVHHLSTFQCDLCEVSYPKEHLLKKHKLTAHAGKSFSCNICNKSYLMKNEYDVHMMLHKGKTPPTKCEECGKIYASVNNYLRHKATHETKPAPSKYICTICDKSFVAHATLKVHLTTHMRKSPYNYECPKCKMYFPPKVLAKHVETHVDIVM